MLIEQRDPLDDRRMCVECDAFRADRCMRHIEAQLLTPHVGRELAAVPQRCAKFEPLVMLDLGAYIDFV